MNNNLLVEGGNVFPDVEPFTKDEAATIFQTLKSVSPTELELNPIGSAGFKSTSGDMDVMVDADQAIELFNVADEKQARAALSQYFKDKGLQSARSGINVHVKVPNKDKFAQVDVMLVKSAGRVSKFHQHDYSVADTPFKGKHKQILLSTLAKNTISRDYPDGLKWSGFRGLIDRKTDNLVSDDVDEIAIILLGPGATSKDLGNVETILNKIPNGLDNPKLADLKDDPNWPNTQELDRIKKLSGV